MTFSFSTTEPAATSIPSVSQAIMQTNNVSSNAILAVDHYTYNHVLGGQHNQVTIPAFTNPSPSAPSSTGSVTYTVAGQASSGTANLIFQNSSCSCLLNAVRAFGYFANSNGVPTMLNSYNFASATFSSSGTTNTYNITLSNNVVASTSAPLFASSTIGSIPGIQWIGTGVLQITVTNQISGFVSWMVLQA